MSLSSDKKEMETQITLASVVTSASVVEEARKTGQLKAEVLEKAKAGTDNVIEPVLQAMASMKAGVSVTQESSIKPPKPR
jgi:hypothetical protein